MKMTKLLVVFCAISLGACSQNNKPAETVKETTTTAKHEPHRYGGWYCPDNLNGFPAVNIKDWKNVPVVNGRMATKEETQNGTSLINVDMSKYPNAKPLDMKMPRLARFFNYSSQKEEFIIVIQALNISNDSIVGFRYLNGGNGSARLNEITFIEESDVKDLENAQFITSDIEIDASQQEVWKILTAKEYAKALQPIFDTKNTLKANWNKGAKVNFKYINNNKNTLTSEYADLLFGNYYIQIDKKIDNYEYVEKFMLTTNQETNKTELKIVCGPYFDDYETQQTIFTNWAQKVKELSEKK